MSPEEVFATRVAYLRQISSLGESEAEDLLTDTEDSSQRDYLSNLLCWAFRRRAWMFRQIQWAEWFNEHMLDHPRSLLRAARDLFQPPRRRVWSVREIPPNPPEPFVPGILGPQPVVTKIRKIIRPIKEPLGIVETPPRVSLNRQGPNPMKGFVPSVNQHLVERRSLVEVVDPANDPLDSRRSLNRQGSNPMEGFVPSAGASARFRGRLRRLA